MRTGIYTITNTVTNKMYVGSSSYDIVTRWSHHRRALRAGTHHSIYLQRAWNKYGETSFSFEVLVLEEPELCVGTEQYWMNVLNTCNKKYGYNMCSVAGSTRGRRLSYRARGPATQQHRDRISQALKGKSKSRAHATLVGIRRKVPIVQLDTEGNELKVWDSAQDVFDILGIVKGNISRCCTGVRPTAGGYGWKYYNKNGDI